MLQYRGPEGYWAWLLHRVSGLGILVFLFAHVLDTMLVGFGPEIYDSVTMIYHNAIARVGEVILAGAVLYHGYNGIRVILIDFWSGAARIQRQLWYGVWVLFFVTFLPAAYFMLRPIIARGL